MSKATGKELQKDDSTVFVRGSCTDKDWRSSKCPLFCIKSNTGGGAGVMQCQNTPEDLFYCAGKAPSEVDCSAKKGVLFFQQSATAYTTIGVEATSTAATTMSEATGSATTSTTSSSATSTKSPNGPLPNDEISNSTSIGVAIGVSLGVVALAILGIWAFFFVRRRRREAAEILPRNDYAPPAMEPSSDTYSTAPSQPYVSGHSANQVYETPSEPKATCLVPQELPSWR